MLGLATAGRDWGRPRKLVGALGKAERDWRGPRILVEGLGKVERDCGRL